MSEARDAIAENQEAAPLPPTPLAVVRHQLWPAIMSVLVLALVTGAGFPLLLTALARPLFPHQSEGSLVSQHGRVIGSEHIGQTFSKPGYFHPRPSAAGSGYDALSSGGSNLAPSNPTLREDVRQLAENYRRQNDLPSVVAVPIDAVTSSGSGLDPHISPANALLQVRRIAGVRGLTEDRLRQLIAEHTQDRQLGFLGQPRVSVLELNLALDRLVLAPSAAPDR
jgi:potassium-transporting ATPase KdpC subunit